MKHKLVVTAHDAVTLAPLLERQLIVDEDRMRLERLLERPNYLIRRIATQVKTCSGGDVQVLFRVVRA